jgi:diamine N-acetyltransferase
MSVRIRPAVVHDAAPLAAFAAEMFRATYATFNTADDIAAYEAAEFGVEQQTADIADPSGFVLIADDGPPIIGYAQIIARPPDAVEIKRFYIASAMHGRGVAQTLMDAVIRTAAARGAPTLWLGVWEQNPRAIAFYRKVGFAEAGVTSFTLGGDVQRDLLMVRDLRAPSGL